MGILITNMDHYYAQVAHYPKLHPFRPQTEQSFHPFQLCNG